MRIQDKNTLIFYGWIKSTIFTSNKITLELIDNEGIIQVETNNDSIIQQINNLTLIDYATIICKLQEDNTILSDIVSISEGSPICKDFNDLPNRHLYNRQNLAQKVIIVSNWIQNYFRTYFQNNNWTEINPPLISTIAEACEDTSSLFFIEQYYGTKAFLVQTSQFYLESLLVPFEKVFSISHSFRNEKKRSHKHLCEYTHIEAEIAWFSLKDLSSFVNSLLKQFSNAIIADKSIYNTIKDLNPNIHNILKMLSDDYESFTYSDCIKILQTNNLNITWGEDFDLEHEKFLTEYFAKPFFVFDWPKHIKAFYMKENINDTKTVEAFDLLLPNGYGELVGASVREDNPQKVWNRLKSDEQMKKLQAEMLSLDVYKWYIDLRQYSSVPHCGFGLGLERLVNWILDLKDIAKATPYPRLPNETNII